MACSWDPLNSVADKGWTGSMLQEHFGSELREQECGDGESSHATQFRALEMFLQGYWGLFFQKPLYFCNEKKDETPKATKIVVIISVIYTCGHGPCIIIVEFQ